MPHVIEKSTDDIEELTADVAGEGWEYRYLQVSPGPLGARYTMLSLPEISVAWFRYAAAIHARESHTLPGVVFTFVIGAAEAPRWCGREFEADMALLYQPRQEHDYVTPRKLFSIALVIQDSLIRRMGWELSGHACLRADRRKLLALNDCCQQLRRQLQRQPLSEAGRQLAQERLAMRLGDALSPWLRDSHGADPEIIRPGQAFAIVRKGIALIHDWPMDRRLDIGILAREIPVHRRTLYRAFQTYLGIGPYEYFLVSRLHAFRQAMDREALRRGAVTRAALQAGFTHLSRFAEQYHQHFAERPRDTLRRWLLASG